jgi:beta-galactosidase/beta-glucuronidase
MVRPDWLSMNGLWEYTILPLRQEKPAGYEGHILVPFPVESALSGVGRPLNPDQRLWYRRSFYIPELWTGRRLLLHFEAVDWEAQVWINGTLAGSHHGGYTPFSLDITPYVRARGENELLVAVWDPTDTGGQARGKQVLHPRTIWYSAVSGIWGTVWLEPVPMDHIRRLKLTPEVDSSCLTVEIDAVGADEEMHVRLEAFDGNTRLAAIKSRLTEPARIYIPNPQLWCPEDPHLYHLHLSILRQGRVLDEVKSYFAMRKFSLGRDGAGRTRLCLNDRPLFQLGPLDQGYWPDGLYTPPSDAAMRYDLEVCKRLGFNMLRKHVKVEPRRFYYHCDQLGLIVWQDMPNGGHPVGEKLSMLAIFLDARGKILSRKDRHSYRVAGRKDPEARQEFESELREMVDALYNCPCIGVWVPFNEGWGQYDARRIAAWLKAYDPTRLVDHASGWFDGGGGDCKSLHIYNLPLKPLPPEDQRAIVLSEFGGYSLKCPGHDWDDKAEFGYKKFDDSESLTEAYIDLFENQLKPWIEAGLSAAIYTQTTDVEIEVNGYLTYDRQVEKMDFEHIGSVHKGFLKSS